MVLDNFFWTIVFLDTGSFGFSPDIGGLILYQSTSDTNIHQHRKLVNCRFALNFVYGKYLDYRKNLRMSKGNNVLYFRNYTKAQFNSAFSNRLGNSVNILRNL